MKSRLNNALTDDALGAQSCRGQDDAEGDEQSRRRHPVQPKHQEILSTEKEAAIQTRDGKAVRTQIHAGSAKLSQHKRRPTKRKS
jgi:hypothetical protein